MKNTLLLLLSLFAFCSCKLTPEELEAQRIENENYHIQMRKKEQHNLERVRKGIKQGNGDTFYIVLEIKQVTYSLDLLEHAKNSANAIRITIPVDPKYWNNQKVGNKLSSSVKTGSLIIDGDISKLNIKIVDKYIK